MQQAQHFNFRQWVKQGKHPAANLARFIYQVSKSMQCPQIPLVHGGLYRLHLLLCHIWHGLAQFWYYTPLFKSRLAQAPKVLELYSGMPQIGGRLRLCIGEGCRISGRSSLFGRSAAQQTPLLQVGRNVDIGWQNTIAVGTKVVLGDHVRLAGNVYLAGFPGHPLAAAARARGEPETDDQVGDIVLEDNVWLASGVTVLAGVRIGRNSIIGAGSVVTRDIPANVIAAGCPAKVVRTLEAEVI